MKDAFGVERTDISKSGNAAKWAARAKANPLSQSLASRAHVASAGAKGTPGKVAAFDNPTKKYVGQAWKRDRLDSVRRYGRSVNPSPKEYEAAFGHSITGGGGGQRASTLARAQESRRAGNLSGARNGVKAASLQSRPRLP
jgi:hypothetical protein